jgi:hypothetical protein
MSLDRGDLQLFVGSVVFIANDDPVASRASSQSRFRFFLVGDGVSTFLIPFSHV